MAQNPRPRDASFMLPHSDNAKNQDMYYIRDVYERMPKSNLKRIIQERTSGPYITYIRSLVLGWPQLQYLADFMDVTAAPPKLKYLHETAKRERSDRTNVSILDFPAKGKVKRTDCKQLANLSALIDPATFAGEKLKARLYVVEDLSCGVIETLGAEYDIDPLLFRGQISDYMWNNPRDPWAEMPSLEITAQQRAFFCLRYGHLRYFRDQDSFNEANTQAGAFNVLRRIDRNRPWEGDEDFDKKGSDIGLVRSKMSLWTRKQQPGDTTTIGILLVDPTIEEGFPLWGGYSNFLDCPSMSKPSQEIEIPPRTTLFEEVIHWTSSLTADEVESLAQDPRIFISKALLIICAEWQTVMKYLTTRLTQLEWELDDTPTTPYRNPNGLDSSLRSLNTWRRRMPVYQEWLTESLIHVITPSKFMGFENTDFSGLTNDFNRLRDLLTEVVARADRIESSISAIISIEESKKAMSWNRMAARLTYLAVIFVPLSWVSSFFSMTPDISQLKSTFWIYLITAVPLTLISLTILQYSAIIDKNFKLKISN